MKKRISSTRFALFQTLHIWSPFLILLLVTLAILFASYLYHNWNFLIYTVLGSAGLPLILSGYFLSHAFNGMRSTPSIPWILSLHSFYLEIENTAHISTIDLRQVKRFVLVSDDDWDLPRGLEDTCLVLWMNWGLIISVPGSSPDFHQLVMSLHQSFSIEVKDLCE